MMPNQKNIMTRYSFIILVMVLIGIEWRRAVSHVSKNIYRRKRVIYKQRPTVLI